MYLIKKGNFEFSKILESGYNIIEGKNEISRTQFANGKRKKILTDYEDCVITLNLGGLDNSDLADYLDNLTDGTFTYFSFNDNGYKTANFLVEKPNLTVNKMISTTNYELDDLTIILEKSSDIE